MRARGLGALLAGAGARPARRLFVGPKTGDPAETGTVTTAGLAVAGGETSPTWARLGVRVDGFGMVCSEPFAAPARAPIAS